MNDDHPPRPFGPLDLSLYRLATALSVAAIVYHQSMVNVIAQDLGVSPTALWSLSAATQTGYGVALTLGLPLADRVAPRRLIPAFVTGLGLIVLALSAAPGLGTMIGLCVLAGLASIGGQMLIVYCSKLEAATYGKSSGPLYSALFTGLLLARVLGGWGADRVGWRAFYAIAGLATIATGIALTTRLRQTIGATASGYFALLRSQGRLWRQSPDLRRVAIVAACFFAALSAIWANLASLLHQSLHWTPAQIGLLAFTAVPGLLASRLAAHLRRRMASARAVSLLGAVLVSVSLTAYVLGPLVAMLVIFVATADICVRGTQVICQGQALAIDPPMAGRLNGLFMTVFFLGSGLGSWLGGCAVQAQGWPGMFLIPVICVAAGLAQMRWFRTPTALATQS